MSAILKDEVFDVKIHSGLVLLSASHLVIERLTTYLALESSRPKRFLLIFRFSMMASTTRSACSTALTLSYESETFVEWIGSSYSRIGCGLDVCHDIFGETLDIVRLGLLGDTTERLCDDL